jgi:hypothetical protein
MWELFRQYEEDFVHLAGVERGESESAVRAGGRIERSRKDGKTIGALGCPAEEDHS